jgi:hypothetical protein
MTALYARLETGFAGMTQIAIVDRPCRTAIVTSTAITSIDKVLHTDVRRPCLHPDSEFDVAYRTLKPNPVKPVRKYDWCYTLRLGIVVEYYVRILGPGNH